MNHTETSKEQGLSAITIILTIAAIVGGGAILVSNTDTGESIEINSDIASGIEAEIDDDANSVTTFICSDGVEIAANFSSDDTAEITLPNGEVRSVTRAEVDTGIQYTSMQGDFVFLGQGDYASVEQGGEVMHEGCVLNVLDEAEVNAGIDPSAAESDAAAATSAETEVDVQTETDTEIQIETGTEVEVDQEY